MNVRAATGDDLPAILAIYNHAIEATTAVFDYRPHTLEMRRDWVGPWHPFLIRWRRVRRFRAVSTSGARRTQAGGLVVASQFVTLSFRLPLDAARTRARIFLNSASLVRN